MTENVIIENDLTDLIIKALGWDYNLWTVMLSDLIFVGLIVLVLFVYVLLKVFIFDRWFWMTELECFHLKMYHEWCNNWKKDMEKNYSDKRRVIKRRICKWLKIFIRTVRITVQARIIAWNSLKRMWVSDTKYAENIQNLMTRTWVGSGAID